ncbi:MAG: YdeI/OmpD-associated family protein [Chloroherpetonaceae bacterium]|nr:YdeI/OmpD-associated family protein [Chloroherpetonaceae bacterium]
MNFLASLESVLNQLPKEKGGYYFFSIESEIVSRFPNGKETRLCVSFNNRLRLYCGLNHLGDGNYYIIFATRYVKSLKLKIGDPVHLEIREDSSPLGVEIPPLIEVFLKSDRKASKNFDSLTDGKKRSLIHGVNKLKSPEKMLEKFQKLLAIAITPKNGRKGAL